MRCWMPKNFKNLSYFRVIAWIILWLAVIACTTFTFLYSIDFGNDKTSKWLTSMIVSFLSSVFITQPVKVS